MILDILNIILTSKSVRIELLGYCCEKLEKWTWIRILYFGEMEPLDLDLLAVPAQLTEYEIFADNDVVDFVHLAVKSM